MNDDLDDIYVIGPPPDLPELPEGPVCGRCYDEVEQTFPANCDEKPEKLINQPLGMYHCPDCGAMVLAGIEHPRLCQRCLDRKHPAFDQ